MMCNVVGLRSIRADVHLSVGALGDDDTAEVRVETADDEEPGEDEFNKDVRDDETEKGEADEDKSALDGVVLSVVDDEGIL
ncbi:hypothetical protein BGZ99_006254 [Dissophora globulifera]|uniref:Uncharacterized protein n=1 Tax=Dissophora globulifera TaxID=979702 RepID=A0A9P6RTZ6_9FUNG|nr:hypothetical protein BGZ99_006254 [Dissophora globulifera]